MRQTLVTTRARQTRHNKLVLTAATLLLGLVLLFGGGALLVRGASEVAQRLGISPMIVGLTIVGFGTSAPELIVNTLSAASGATELAFGNVVGSNVTNLALVLGAAALMSPITIHGQIVKREIPLLLLATTVVTVMGLDNLLESGPALIGRTDAVILILLFCIFIYTNVLELIGSKHKDALFLEFGESPLVVIAGSGRFQWLFVVAGCALLFAGGDLTVRAAVDLASVFGVSATVIGLFVVAVGTSLPELVTSIIAAARKESDLALGNVVGSNLFNSLVVLPVSGLIRPIPVPAGGVFDLAVSFGLTLVLIPVFILGKARLTRRTGGVLILVYVSYAAIRIFSDVA